MEHLATRRWRKSSFSGNGGADCVEAGLTAEAESVPVRDTQGSFGLYPSIHPGRLAYVRRPGEGGFPEQLTRPAPVPAGSQIFCDLDSDYGTLSGVLRVLALIFAYEARLVRRFCRYLWYSLA